MSLRELRQASIHVVEGQSLVVPLIIEGLPESIEALDRGWARKREFHLTALAARLLDPPEERPDVWDQIGQVAAGRQLGPVRAGGEFRRVSHPNRADLETLIVMAECPGLDELVRDLSQAIAGRLPVPPAHVTLYSTDAAQGIGITDERELAERAPPLSESEQEDIRRAVGW